MLEKVYKQITGELEEASLSYNEQVGKRSVNLVAFEMVAFQWVIDF